MSGHLWIISTGPGGVEWIPPAVMNALGQADLFLGYSTYLEQIRGLFPEIPREFSSMRQETARVERAVALAQAGKKVAVISGGDAGIFGMAGLVLEVAAAQCPSLLSEIEVLPGISALNAAAALLGAPLMTDFAVISLSDYLIPLETILRRVEAAAKAGFVLCLYNPKSKTRTEPFEKACAVLLANLSGDTLVGIVKGATRADQAVRQLRLRELPDAEIGMDCVLIVGNPTTQMLGGRMVTPRGYKIQPTKEG